MVYCAIIAVGVMAFLQLRVDLFPKLSFPSISVVVEYPGVGPEEMETLVTRQLEEAVARVEGVDRIESFSTEGRSRVALRFDWGVPLETALNDVRAATERARATLPEDAEAPVVYKFDLSNIPVLELALRSSMDEATLRRFADDVVKPRLERVTGVASVEVRGARDREIRVSVDMDALASVGATLTDVSTALQRANVTVPAGPVEDGPENLLIRAMSEFTTLEEISQAPVAQRGGYIVRVADVAVVEDTFEEYANIVRIDGAEGVEIRVIKSPDANSIEVADALLVAVDSFNQDFEGRAALEVTVDSSVFIRRSISDVQSSLLAGAALAIVILLVFLRSLRATLVVATAIPISILATFFLMFQLDLTLNLISFGGLALGLGMLVDNAIVILENIFRRRQMGDSSHDAAINGASEVSGAIVASTLTTVAVFAPVPFLTGFASVFFTQMALVVSAALACSLFVALTLVPVLSSGLLGKGDATPAKDPAFLRALDSSYARLTELLLRQRTLVVIAAIVVFAASLQFVGRIGSELLPSTDESEVRIGAEYPVGTRIEITRDAAIRIEELIRENVPEVVNVLTSIGTPGFWSTDGEESVSFRVNLVPVNERDRSSAEVAAAIQPILSRELPGMDVRARPGTGLWIFRFIRGGDTRLRVDIRGFDLDVAEQLTNTVMARMGEIDGISGIRSTRSVGGREMQLWIDRARVAEYGLSAAEVAEAVSTLVQGRQAGVYRESGDEFRIRVRLGADDLRSVERVLASPIRVSTGQFVPLSDLVVRGSGRTPLAIDRMDQERIVSIEADPDPSMDLGTLNAIIRDRLREVSVPEGFSVIVAGEAEEQADAFGSLFMGILLAVALVYMIMAGQFESLIQPLVIMAAVPFAGVGIIVTLIVTDTTFNLNSFMGSVVLVGVVVNNAIVLVDYANMLRNRDGMGLTEAVVEASRRRLRPILMTTSTTVLALLPVAIGAGTGSETQTPLARVVVGGLLVSTAVTLVLIPVLYHGAESMLTWLKERKTRQA
jgi:HAE1 family hydrophobic/amphiphilic exporter-1